MLAGSNSSTAVKRLKVLRHALVEVAACGGAGAELAEVRAFQEDVLRELPALSMQPSEVLRKHVAGCFFIFFCFLLFFIFNNFKFYFIMISTPFLSPLHHLNDLCNTSRITSGE